MLAGLHKLKDIGDIYRFAAFKLDERFHAAGTGKSVHALIDLRLIEFCRLV
jgi:hypothetical protein